MEYTPNTVNDRQKMLKTIGVSSIEELFSDIPEALKLHRELNLPAGLSEMEVAAKLTALAAKNRVAALSFTGGGVYQHYIPAAVQALVSRAEFYTAYTPYQPEISQGVLQAIFEYQTMICRLTGMEAANASLYDGSTALAEGAMMCCAITRKNRILVSATVHPEYREVLNTYCRARSIEVKEIPHKEGVTDLENLRENITPETAGILIQSPNFFGALENLEAIGSMKGKALLVSCLTDAVVLGMLKPVKTVDIVTGEGQSFGNAINFGGPHLGIIACAKQHMRKLPGRIVGKTADHHGREGYVLTLQAREQHIRREGATSNICSNQALCALAATIYLAVMGNTGLKQAAEQSFRKAHYAFEKLSAVKGLAPRFTNPFFHEFVIRCSNPAEVNRKLLKENIIGGIELGRYYPELADSLLFYVNETINESEIRRMVQILEKA